MKETQYGRLSNIILFHKRKFQFMVNNVIILLVLRLNVYIIKKRKEKIRFKVIILRLQALPS
jgi:hypothetical protein